MPTRQNVWNDNWEKLKESFPFAGYIRDERMAGYKMIAETVSAFSPPGSRLLDFGAGPCDKVGILTYSGYSITAFDDFGDIWHSENHNKEKILEFCEKIGIDYYEPDESGAFTFPKGPYDMLLLNGVVEHLHDSPRVLLNSLIEYLRVGGHVMITVPNAANLRKRLSLLFGRTIYSRFQYYYWSPGPWRGHNREYVKGDLKLLAEYLGLTIRKLETFHLLLDRLGPVGRRVFRMLSACFPGFRDTWILVAEKPENWQPRTSLPGEEMLKMLGRQYFDHSTIFGNKQPEK